MWTSACTWSPYCDATVESSCAKTEKRKRAWSADQTHHSSCVKCVTWPFTCVLLKFLHTGSDHRPVVLTDTHKPAETMTDQKTNTPGLKPCLMSEVSLWLLVFARHVLFDFLQPHEDEMGLVEEFTQDGRADIFIFPHDVDERRACRLRTWAGIHVMRLLTVCMSFHTHSNSLSRINFGY